MYETKKKPVTMLPWNIMIDTNYPKEKLNDPKNKK